jgi:protein-disulfide isomerase
LGGASCKKSTAQTDDAPGVVGAIDKAEKGGKADPADKTGSDPKHGQKGHDHSTHTKPKKANAPIQDPKSTEPVPGIDLGKLDTKKKNRFFALIEDRQSPCGKGHDLRTSIIEDTDCKRAVFAARYIVELLSDEQEDSDIQEFYDLAYRDQKNVKFKTEGVPHTGPADAPVALVEFYDYGCPACKYYKSIIEEVAAHFRGKLVVYYKQYPLLHAHPNSGMAAQAALAANKQGKFKEMHDKLFDMSDDHKRKSLWKYAESLSLDMTKFQIDYESADRVVKAESKEGDAAGVSGTPTMFINGRIYQGPGMAKYMKMWVDEELAVNR